MMDGLECCEVLMSQIFHNNPYFRIDAEFYNRNAVRIENIIHSLPHFYIERDMVVSGPFGSTLKSESYLSSGDVPFIRIENIRGGFYINLQNIVYINQSDNERIKNSELHTDDIVLSKVGNTIGFFARVDERLALCNISENNIGIKTSQYPALQRKFILAYLNSNYAQALVLRRTSGNAQPKLNVGDVCMIPIPCFSERLYSMISQLIDKSEEVIVLSEKKYKEAETVLAELLNLQIQKQSSPVVSEKAISISYNVTGRLDAEYYQPKYDRLFSTLKNYNCKPLGGENGLVSIKKSIEPGSDYYQNDGVPFIRVSDVSKFQIDEPEIHLPLDIVDNIEELYPRKDTILFSKDGSVGIAYKVEDTMEVITSGALLHLTIKNPDEILPDYLTMVLNSPIVQLQAERDTNGAIIQHWKPSEIEKVVIPVLDMDKQIEISDKVKESFALRKKSKQLLEDAKRAVEIAIEQDEESAIEWLKDRKKEAGV